MVELFLKSRAQEDKKLAKEEREERPTLKQVVCIDGSRFFFSLSLSLSFILFLFPPAVITESNVKGDDEEFGAHLILHLL